jgi:hypothetical protein
MGHGIDSNALKESNVTFANGALKGMKYDSFTAYENGVKRQQTMYVANLKNGGLFNKVPVFSLQIYEKQQNGAKVNKFNDSKYEFKKLSNVNISLDKDLEHGVKDISLFGCKNVLIDAKDYQAEEISIHGTKDSKSDVTVYMDEGDILYDYTRGVKVTAKGNTNYFQLENKGYQINTELPDGRLKFESHDGNGNVSTRYFSKDGKELN